MTDVILEALRTKNVQSRQSIVELLEMVTWMKETLMVLNAGHVLMSEDDRRYTTLNISPTFARQWKKQIAEAQTLTERITNELQLEKEHDTHAKRA